MINLLAANNNDLLQKTGTWLFVVVLSFVAVWLSHALEFDSHNVTVVWPAGGISIWLVLRFGYRSWLPIFAGTEIYHFFFISPYEPLLVLVSLSNTFSAVVGALVYRHYIKDSNPFGSVNSVLAMVVAVSLSQALVSAVPGMMVVGYLYVDTWQAWRSSFAKWLMSDVAGVIICLPFLLALQRNAISLMSLKVWAKPAFLTGATLVLVYAVSNSGSTDLLLQYPALLISMPLSIWLALKSETVPAVVSLVCLIVGSLYLSLLAALQLSDQMFIYSQAYASVIIGCSLILHAMNLECENALRQLKQQAQKLESVVAERTADLKSKVLETQALADSLAKQSNTDYLTGINNRRAFVSKLQNLLQNTVFDERYGVLLVDIDFFKEVNDHYGHEYGDKCLIAVAQLLGQYSENANGFAGRLGGEEFACVLPFVDNKELSLHAEHLLQRIASLQFAHKGKVFSITASLGGSEIDLVDGYHAIDNALRAADKQLYKAKRSGRNRASFEASPELTVANSGAAAG